MRSAVPGPLALTLALGFAPLPSLGSGGDEVRQQVGNILAQEKLSGPQRASAVQETLRGLSDAQFLALASRLGAPPVLAHRPQTDAAHGAPSPESAAEGQASQGGAGVATNARERTEQLHRALRSPQQRERLIRSVANYLLNTSK